MMINHEVENNSKHPIITVVWILFSLSVIVAAFGSFLTAF